MATASKTRRTIGIILRTVAAALLVAIVVGLCTRKWDDGRTAHVCHKSVSPLTSAMVPVG
ncbi:MAG: hypothetical protein ACREA0_03120 [bacterium]